MTIICKFDNSVTIHSYDLLAFVVCDLSLMRLHNVMTIQEFADLKGCTRECVSRNISSGNISAGWKNGMREIPDNAKNRKWEPFTRSEAGKKGGKK